MSSVTVCNCPQNTPDPTCLRAVSSRPSDQQQKKPDGRTCWAGSMEWRLDDCWPNADAGGKQCQILVCSGRSDTMYMEWTDNNTCTWTYRLLRSVLVTAAIWPWLTDSSSSWRRAVSLSSSFTSSGTVLRSWLHTDTDTHTHRHTGSNSHCPREPGLAGCPADNKSCWSVGASFFYRQDGLPPTQPTTSVHWRHYMYISWVLTKPHWRCTQLLCLWKQSTVCYTDAGLYRLGVLSSLPVVWQAGHPVKTYVP